MDYLESAQDSASPRYPSVPRTSHGKTSITTRGSRFRPGSISRTWKQKSEFIHRDLKPQNFLIGDDGHILMADFGFAKESRDLSIEDTIVGTLNYISPEYFQRGVVGKITDYWALGCILYEMITGEVAF